MAFQYVQFVLSSGVGAIANMGVFTLLYDYFPNTTYFNYTAAVTGILIGSVINSSFRT